MAVVTGAGVKYNAERSKAPRPRHNRRRGLLLQELSGLEDVLHRQLLRRTNTSFGLNRVRIALRYVRPVLRKRGLRVILSAGCPDTYGRYPGNYRLWGSQFEAMGNQGFTCRYEYC
jgi:hypothetical protein